MVECLFDAQRKFDEVYPESKCKQRLKMHLMERTSYDEHATVGK